MLRLFILICTFLVVGASLYHFMLQGAGYLLIVWGKTSIEMSLWVALTLLLILILSLLLVIKIYTGGIRSLLALKRSFVGRGSQKAHAQMLDGLTDFIEGDWLNARKKLERSAQKVDSPLINYLAAARSAYELGDEKKAMALLHQAEEATDKTHLAIPLTQAKMQLASQQYEQALATLERATAIQEEHTAIVDLKRQAYLALQDWDALKKLLPFIEKNSLGSAKERDQLTLNIHKQCLLNAAANHGEKSNRLDALKQCWRETPNAIKQDKHLLALYARELMTVDDDDRAERILSDGLNNQWHEHWIRLYGMLNCSDYKIPLATAEKWLKHQNSHGLYLTLGRLCAKGEQWGRALDYFNQSLSAKASTEVYAELAKVHEQLGQKDKSQENYKQGLLLAMSQH